MVPTSVLSMYTETSRDISNMESVNEYEIDHPPLVPIEWTTEIHNLCAAVYAL